MDRMQKIILGLFVVVLLLLTYLEASEPEPINWNPSYTKVDKIPLGGFVLFENLKAHHDSIHVVNIPTYEKLKKDSIAGTYFFLNEMIAFDDAELGHLLQWVEKGNDLFISARYVNKSLLDTLNLEKDEIFTTQNINSKPLIELANPVLKSDKPYFFDRNVYIQAFTKIDTAKTVVLGFTQPYEDEIKMDDPQVNFIQQEFGKGKITIHLAPEAFSNYFILFEENREYTEAALAYIDFEKPLYWDAYKKEGKTFYTSPLYVFLNNEKLKWAYYFTLLGCILFIIFEGKRKQRNIPVVEPPKNQTYNYTRTIAGLYLEKKQYKEIASKKIKLFSEFLRTKLRIESVKLNDAFYTQVASRSGNSVEETKMLFQLISEIEQRQRISKEELLNLSKKINKFKNR
ncbi:MAG TPA: DUF4350 domain-containing protein [Salinimicrobium sp.]|nr:DUF4350 domain-containing protein [Salinimicrobium sp.]